MRSITGKTKAWLTRSDGPEVLDSTPDRVVSEITYSSHDMRSAGWTLLGEAEITVHVVGEQQIVENKIEALRAEKDSVIAFAQARATEIEGKIQNLLAISYTPEEA